MPFWRLALLKAMFEAATGAWDQEQLDRSSSGRTVSIPTGTIATAEFELARSDANDLFRRGYRRAQQFFARVTAPQA